MSYLNNMKIVFKIGLIVALLALVGAVGLGFSSLSTKQTIVFATATQPSFGYFNENLRRISDHEWNSRMHITQIFSIVG